MLTPEGIEALKGISGARIEDQFFVITINKLYPTLTDLVGVELLLEIHQSHSEMTNAQVEYLLFATAAGWEDSSGRDWQQVVEDMLRKRGVIEGDLPRLGFETVARAFFWLRTIEMITLKVEKDLKKDDPGRARRRRYPKGKQVPFSRPVDGRVN